MMTVVLAIVILDNRYFNPLEQNLARNFLTKYIVFVCFFSLIKM